MSALTGTIPVESQTASPPPTRSANLAIALVVIGGAQLMIVLDGTIVNIALPHIQTALGFSQSGLSWVVNAYALALGSLLLLGGRLGDVVGRRRMFVTGVLLFAAASMVGGLAVNELMLISSRVVQGAGAAIASPAALALITTTFPAGKERNRAMGVYAAMSGAGAAVGLILGGFLTEIDWRWTFFINVPIGLAVALLAPRYLNESEPKPGRFDLLGAATGTLGLVGLVYGLTHASESGWLDWVTLGSLGAGAALLAAFVAVERAVAQPLLPLRILADRTRAVSLVSMLAVGAGMFAMFFFLGLYIQQVLGYSPVKSGFAFLPFSFGIVLAAGLASALVSRVDPRWLSGPGAVLAVVGMWGFTHLTTSSSYLTGLLPWIVLLAFGLGLTFVPMTLTAVAGVADQDSGAGSAVLNTAQQIGGALGLAALTTVFTGAFTDKAAELAAGLQARGGATPSAEALAAARQQLALEAQTYASTRGFLMAAGFIAVAAVLIFLGLNVSARTLAEEESAHGAIVEGPAGQRIDQPVARLVDRPARPADRRVGRHRRPSRRWGGRSATVPNPLPELSVDAAG